MGSIGIGKTEVSKYLANKLQIKHIEWESLISFLKEKLGGEDGPLEELPFKEIISHFKREFSNNSNYYLVFDNWHYSLE